VLDYFEDVGYSREMEQMLVSENKIGVELYAWPENPGKEIKGELKGSWGEKQIKEFKENHLQHFTDELIPKALKNYGEYRKRKEMNEKAREFKIK